MPTLGTYPPTERAQAVFGAIEGIRSTEGEVLGLEGPDGHLGPEAAGCLMVLHATMADEEAAGRFWELLADVTSVVTEVPGLIRFVGFDDGLSGYAIAWWRTEEDARTFAKGQEHREAVKEHYRSPVFYTHYVGLFAPTTAGERHAFCEECGGMTQMPAEACGACGTELVDVFQMQPERTGAAS